MMPAIPAALRLAAWQRPVWQLQHPDGSPYLTRTVLHGIDSLDDNNADVPFSIYIHQIHTADGDRHMHDHPWAWACGVVLSGGYTERRVAQGDFELTRTYSMGDLNVLRPGDYHSIVAVEPGTVTLFAVGRRVSDWGFLVDGTHVGHREYGLRPDAQKITTVRLA